MQDFVHQQCTAFAPHLLLPNKAMVATGSVAEIKAPRLVSRAGKLLLFEMVVVQNNTGHIIVAFGSLLCIVDS